MTAVLSHPDALSALEEQLNAVVASRLSPPPTLTLSQWADEFRVLSREASAEPGQWRTDRAPYLRGIQDAISDPTIETVVLMMGSQSGKTEVLLNTCGYYGHQDPAPVMIVLPTIGDAEQWSKTRLAPMLRDTPALRSRFKDPKSRNSGNTLLVKEYPGGHITMVGANAPSGLAAKPIRVLLTDELDRFPASAGTEGDPLSLAAKRTATFWNRKKVFASTPTLKGSSRIEASYLEGDQRHYVVPCPECDEDLVLRWKHLRWERGHPETAAYACEHCGCLIPEQRKTAMLAAGRWVATAESTARKVSFHLPSLYSPWARWSELVEEFDEVQGNLTRLQVFVNTVLAETWEERVGGLDPEAIQSRKETYPAEVPAGVAVLTMGVDVQDDRLEWIIRGWGAGEQSWPIARGIAVGDPSLTIDKEGSPWKELEAERVRIRVRASGPGLRPLVTLVDSGAHTSAVYAYTKPRERFRVFSTKGYSTPGKPLVGRRPLRNNKARAGLWMIGTEAGKDAVLGALKLASPGPGYMHIPDWLDEEWFAQVTAEKPVMKQVTGGRWVRQYVCPRGVRNEALDIEVLCLVGLRIAPIRLSDLGKIADRATAAGAEWCDPAEQENTVSAEDAAESPGQDPGTEQEPGTPPAPKSWVKRLPRGGSWRRW